MNEKSWLGVLGSCSDNLKSKIQNLKWLRLSVIAFVFVVAEAVAHAQQPTKIPRIGYLNANFPPLTRPASRHSGRVCASLGTSRGKTLSLSGALQREN